MASLPIPSRPWEEISWDFITDLPLSSDKTSAYDSILVVVDRYTKMSLYIPVTKTITAVDLAEVFIQKVVRNYGVLVGIVSNQGSVFTSKF